jgi:outer membrane protein TolC
VTARGLFSAVLLATAGCVGGIAKPLPPLHPRAADLLRIPEDDDVPADSDSLTLLQAYHHALGWNERVGLSHDAMRAAEIEWRGTSTELAPTISLSGSASRQNEQTISGVVLQPGQQVLAGVTVAQPLYRHDFGAAREAGEQGFRSARAAYQRERQRLARDVVAAYIDVVRTRKLVDLAGAAVDRAKTQQQLAIARVKAGQSLRNAELLATVDLTRAQRLAVTAQRDSEVAALEFQRLVGRPPPKQLDVPPLPELPDPDQGIDLAMKREDVRALELELARAEAAQRAARNRRWWPRLDLQENVQYANPKILADSITYQILGMVTVPILQGGQEFVDVALRENDVHAAALRLEQLRKLVLQDVRTASVQVSSSHRAVELADQQRAAARENYQLVDKQVRLGAITPVDVTIAQSVLTEAETAFEVATMENAVVAYDYLFAIGTLDLEATPEVHQRAKK